MAVGHRARPSRIIASAVAANGFRRALPYNAMRAAQRRALAALTRGMAPYSAPLHIASHSRCRAHAATPSLKTRKRGEIRRNVA